jgi:GDP-4-dehydro-6-deoxy-D-mannose reductase
MKVLITGITGSGGSYLAEYILDNIQDVKVIGTTRDHSSNRNIETIKDKVELHYLDLTDSLSVYRLFDTVRPDIVFHIASIANVRKSFDVPHEVITNNVMLTLNLLEAVRLLKLKDGYNPIIQICSTSEVYGNVAKENIPIKETCPLKPINPYAVSKMTQDNLGYVYFLNYGMNIIRTRMFTYLNPKRPDLFATAFGKQLLDIKKGKRNKLVYGNLDSYRTFIDVREAAEAYWVAATQCKVGEVYNIGGSDPHRISDFLFDLIDAMGMKLEDFEHEQDKNLLRPSDIEVQIPDMSKFTQETGWRQTILFGDSLRFFVKELERFWN